MLGCAIAYRKAASSERAGRGAQEARGRTRRTRTRLIRAGVAHFGRSVGSEQQQRHAIDTGFDARRKQVGDRSARRHNHRRGTARRARATKRGKRGGALIMNHPHTSCARGVALQGDRKGCRSRALQRAAPCVSLSPSPRARAPPLTGQTMNHSTPQRANSSAIRAPQRALMFSASSSGVGASPRENARKDGASAISDAALSEQARPAPLTVTALSQLTIRQPGAAKPCSALAAPPSGVSGGRTVPITRG